MGSFEWVWDLCLTEQCGTGLILATGDLGVGWGWGWGTYCWALAAFDVF